MHKTEICILSVRMPREHLISDVGEQSNEVTLFPLRWLWLIHRYDLKAWSSGLELEMNECKAISLIRLIWTMIHIAQD